MQKLGGEIPLPIELGKHIGRMCHVLCKDVRARVAKMARNRDWSFLSAMLNGTFGESEASARAIAARIRGDDIAGSH